MRPLALPLAVAVLVSLAPVALRAQASADSIGLRPGAWAVEGIIGGSSDANLLRFTSRRTAIVLGGSFTTARVTATIAGPFVPDTAKVKQDNLTLSVGMRQWLSDSTRVRLFRGAGVFASYVHSNDPNGSSNSVMPGAYGEFGASSFIMPRVSLNGTGRLAFQQVREDDVQAVKVRGWALDGRLAQLSLTIYF